MIFRYAGKDVFVTKLKPMAQVSSTRLICGNEEGLGLVVKASKHWD